jgi:hypothetical protein
MLAPTGRVKGTVRRLLCRAVTVISHEAHMTDMRPSNVHLQRFNDLDSDFLLQASILAPSTMSALLSTAICFLYIGTVYRTTPNRDSDCQYRRYVSGSRFVQPHRELTRPTGNRTPITSICTFNDNSLLKIFYHCRPLHLDEDQPDDDRVLEGMKWDSECWWYNLAQVCRKWRYLVLASASHLRLSLVCTYGVPIADMLAYSPPLPLVIDYGDENREVTTEDERGILLALQRRPRVRHIRLCMPSSKLWKLVEAMNEEFPVLECLHIKSLNGADPCPIFPEMFKTPRIRHLTLRNATHSPDISRLQPPTLCHQSLEAISQCAKSCGGEFWRYALISYHVYWLVSEQGL